MIGGNTMKALKVWELDLTMGKKYVDVFGEVWEVVGNPTTSPKFGYLPPDIDTDLRREKDGALFTDNLQGVQHLRLWTFKEVIDWTQVPIDTKVLVSTDGISWHHRHYAGRDKESGKIFVWRDGYTSFTAPKFLISQDYQIDVNFIKLYEEEE